jgi:hypothetical protein
LIRSPVPAAARLSWQRTRNIKRQVHRSQYLLGYVLDLDEGNEAERGLALGTDDLDAEGFLNRSDQHIYVYILRCCWVCPARRAWALRAWKRPCCGALGEEFSVEREGKTQGKASSR